MKYLRTKIMLIAVLCLIPITAVSCSGEDTRAENNNEISEEDKSMEGNDTPNISVTPIEEAMAVEDKKNEVETVKDEIIIEEKGPVWSFLTNGGIASSPVNIGDNIYFGSKDGNFYAVNKDTGAEVWRYAAGAPILCQPAILDNTLFFSSKEIFIAVNAETGAEVWKADLKPLIRTTFRKDQWDYHDSSPVIDHGVVYFGSGSGAVLGFDIASGELKWEFSAPNGVAVRSTPTIQDGVIYYGDWNGNFRAVDIATKSILWENNYKKSFQSAVVIKDGIIYIGGRDTYIHAIDSKTGESKWSYQDPDGSWITGDPVVDGDIVYFSTSDAKKVYAINIKDGSVVLDYPIYKNSFTKVLIDNGYLYATTGDAYVNPGTGKLQVYKLNVNENVAWEVSLNSGGVFTSPLMVEGILYIGCEDGYLYAISSN